MIVIGMGSGRCGTKSLAKLLDLQENAQVTHEYGEPLHWDLNQLHWQLWEDRLEKWRKDPSRIDGDVASWYLPYIEEMLREEIAWPIEPKVIVLKRDKDETVESFDEWTGDGNRWQEAGGNWPEYDHAFPTYPDGLDKREAIGQYWEDYYESCSWLEDNFPEIVKVFDIDVLNSEEGQQEIFDFMGIDGEPVLPLKENQRPEKRAN